MSGGRAHVQFRLKELSEDPKLSNAQRGWLKQELNRIDRGQSKNLRNPPGYQLAHQRGFEAQKGFSYVHANLQTTDLHRLQHRHDNGGRSNQTPSAVANFREANSGKLSSLASQLQMRDVYRSSQTGSAQATSGLPGGGLSALKAELSRVSQNYQQACNMSYSQFESAPRPGASGIECGSQMM
uniref:Bacterial toxin 8 domain-containing protein n=1 Tax=Plectus sambesii TaxID=2011161 RepID=A0A914VDC3_9BILA